MAHGDSMTPLPAVQPNEVQVPRQCWQEKGK
jgi:hypothetical protein